MLELPLEWDAELLGGLGDRNNRRGLLARRILRHGLLVQNQINNANHSKYSWTFRRSTDGTLVRTSPDFHLVTTIGTDHRCSH